MAYEIFSLLFGLFYTLDLHFVFSKFVAIRNDYMFT